MLIDEDIQSHFLPYEKEIYRLVEGQHFIATRKLVDDDQEQTLLEEMLEAAKPIAPQSNRAGKLHYLLFTPFRYPPLKGGGRFHTPFEQSLFYGSETLATAMAEIAYGRFQFMQESTASLSHMDVPYTHFVVKTKTNKALYLTKEPFKKYKAKISHPNSYEVSQFLGSLMRKEGAELFTYFSARQKQAINVGILSPEAFALNTPVKGKEKQWQVYISHDRVEFHRQKFQSRHKESFTYLYDALRY